jgi:hypothetical protein
VGWPDFTEKPVELSRRVNCRWVQRPAEVRGETRKETEVVIHPPDWQTAPKVGRVRDKEMDDTI